MFYRAFPSWLPTSAATGLYGLLCGATGSGAAALPILAWSTTQGAGPGLANGLLLVGIAVLFGGLVGALAALPVSTAAAWLDCPEARVRIGRLALSACVGVVAGGIWASGIAGFGALCVAIVAGPSALVAAWGPGLVYLTVLSAFGALMFGWFVPAWVAVRANRTPMPAPMRLPTGDGYAEVLAIVKTLKATPVPAHRVGRRDQAVRACEAVVVSLAESRAWRGDATVGHYRTALAAATEAQALLDGVDLTEGPRAELRVVQEMLRRRVA